MNKISFLITIILISLAVNAEWIVDENDDPFNGKSITVIGSDKLMIGGLAFTSKDSIIILNGDSYICTNPNYSSYQYIDVQFKVDDQIFSQEFAISDGRNSLVYREKLIGSGLTISKSDFTKSFSKKVYSNRGIDIKKFANLLRTTKNFLIRTTDGCGETVDLEIDMAGYTEAIDKLKL